MARGTPIRIDQWQDVVKAFVVPYANTIYIIKNDQGGGGPISTVGSNQSSPSIKELEGYIKGMTPSFVTN
ncbi:hypothetical protein K2173_003671 [Erythroxylum novogranatense]|uniref:Uncharacterized protein n=1 Tax=Erythroxylum novogranatense TaxID=1862640 RepID=A0AAV8TD00_9ROSI|nr:hypothetical protein K2173_003671 [Erythroxylum novogranatense]